MIKKIKSELIEASGLTLLLLTSFYFFKFSYFAVPDFFFILKEILKISLFLFIISYILIFTIRYDYKNILLFLLNTYLLIFLLKLVFNISGNISLHHFLKIFYSNIFYFEVGKKIPLYAKIISYITPFIIIFSFLFLFKNKLREIKKFLILFGFIISLLVFWDLYKIFDKHYLAKDIKLEKINKNVNNQRKVLWLFFDGMDPEYINIKIDQNKIFRNLNYLNENGIFHSNMYPPSNWTLYSTPSQLMGINIKKMTPKHDTLIFRTLKDNEVPFNFQNTIFGKLNSYGLEVSLLSSVLEYCTAYIISNNWNFCEDTNTNNRSNSIFKDSLKYYFSFFFKFKIYLHELGIISLKANTNNILNEKLNNNMSKIQLNSIGLERMYSSNFKNNYYADHMNVINIEKIIKNFKNTNLMFAHIYNPHLYNNSDIHIQNKINYKFEGDQYILKYIYSDIFLGKLINEIKKIYKQDLLLIISSDHWNRSKDISDKKRDINGNYIGNSYFYAKVINDNDSFKIDKPSSSLIIVKLIENYFFEKINSNRDIFNLIENNKIKINTLMNK